MGIWTPRICGERQGITISLAQDIRSKETTTRSCLFHAELLSPTFPCPHFCFTETASPRCVVPPLPAPGEGRAKPFHTQTIPWGSCSGRSPRKALPGLGTTAQLWQETHQAVNTPRLWERNPARPAPLQSLPGCRMPFIQQTSVCPLRWDTQTLCRAPALLVAAVISYMDLFCFPVEHARSPHAVFGGEGSLLSWEQGC